MSDKQLIDLSHVRITTKKNKWNAMKGLEHKQSYLFTHFKDERHTEFLNDIVITFVDKTDGSDPTRREFWI